MDVVVAGVADHALLAVMSDTGPGWRRTTLVRWRFGIVLGTAQCSTIDYDAAQQPLRRQAGPEWARLRVSCPARSARRVGGEF